MTRKDMMQAIQVLYETCSGNFLKHADGIVAEEMEGKLFDAPLVGIGSAIDPLFFDFCKSEIIGPWFLQPTEWLQNAKTVISLFFPFMEEVKRSNCITEGMPSMLWLYGRVEGQEYLAEFGKAWKQWFTEHGIPACVPVNDERFREVSPSNIGSDCGNQNTFGSNWSERHAAYVCGLGTFGLSKGLITEKGMAGRILSIIIAEELQPDERKYTEIYEYCTQCGACIERCPVQAISFAEGKKHAICNAWLKQTKELFAPRFGCGLCQTGVPCESRNPSKKE